jgi:tetratricopeptide (TPR) repeat protein
MTLPSLALIVVLASQASVPPLPLPAPGSPRATAQPTSPDGVLLQQYLRGDADAAVEFASKTVPMGFFSVGGNPLGDRHTYSQAAQALLVTEAGFLARTFGRYALSAPLTPAPATIGLSGRFELRSRIASLLVEEVVAAGRENPADAALDVARQWYLVSVSYCLRWNLDCADALVASAERDFPDDPEILLLRGSYLETRGRWTTAAATLQRALDADPRLVEARVRLGRVDWRRGRTQASATLLAALADARTFGHVVSEYFALLALADLNQSAGRADRAGARRAEAAAVQPFRGQPDLAALDPWAAYRAAQFYQVADRLARLRRTVRRWAEEQPGA